MNLQRRSFIESAAALGGVSALSNSFLNAEVQLKGHFQHSMVYWCFKNFAEKWDIEKQCQIAKKLGIKSIELSKPDEHWQTMKKHDLTCAIVGSHGFKDGPNHKKNWDKCREIILKRLDEAKNFGCPNVITFTGFSNGIDPEEGGDNCVQFWKSIIGKFEKAGVNLTIEHLNSRATESKMHGHPGYQGDHVDYCVDLIKRVGSTNMKLLFDVYHVQIMDGDLIRRIKEHKDVIGHIHTAGNPGRHELDDTQEINYPAVMRALKDTGYKGFIGHEFIPSRNPEEGLREAVTICDV